MEEKPEKLLLLVQTQCMDVILTEQLLLLPLLLKFHSWMRKMEFPTPSPSFRGHWARMTKSSPETLTLIWGWINNKKGIYS